jgi:hypothetical protein
MKRVQQIYSWITTIMIIFMRMMRVKVLLIYKMVDHLKWYSLHLIIKIQFTWQINLIKIIQIDLRNNKIYIISNPREKLYFHLIYIKGEIINLINLSILLIINKHYNTLWVFQLIWMHLYW